MDVEQVNRQIAEIMKWDFEPSTEKIPFERWYRSNGGADICSGPPNYCGMDNLAAEFRQFTLKHEWCRSVTLSMSDGQFICDVGVIYEVDEDGKGVRIGSFALPWCDTEAEASSRACLEAVNKFRQYECP